MSFVSASVYFQMDFQLHKHFHTRCLQHQKFKLNLFHSKAWVLSFRLYTLFCYNLDRHNLSLLNNGFDFSDDSRKEDLINRRLWESSNMESYLAEMRKESKRRRQQVLLPLLPFAPEILTIHFRQSKPRYEELTEVFIKVAEGLKAEWWSCCMKAEY